MSGSGSVMQFAVPGISCGHCVRAITEEVERLAGVETFVVSIDAKTVIVSGTATVDEIVGAIAEAGYEVDTVTAG